MRIDKVYIENFKNLKNFSIDLDESQMNTVLLGENASGKSNFLEALVIIFRDLDLDDSAQFDYTVKYKCNNNFLKAIGNKGKKGKLYIGEKLKDGSIKYKTRAIIKKEIAFNRDQYLPKYVFSYYSGVSSRLLEHFDKHQLKFYKDLLDGIDDPFRPLFYARLIHSYFVLLAFYGYGDDKVKEFLEDYLNIIDLESVLFVMKKPDWSGDKKLGDPKFWYAKGVVKDFLNELWNASIGPIYHKEKIREDFNKHPDEEHLFLYISNQKKLEKIAKKYKGNVDFFKKLESTYMSDLIHEVRVKVKKRGIDDKITFKELSEGEQQLLTVIGLLRFTKAEESLILLDEPDTHLNPLWKWKYMKLLNDYSEKDESSQIIMTTHDPLVIGGLTKKEIRVFSTEKELDKNGKETYKIKTLEPDFDPKGLGVAGILTSEFFNLPSSLDFETEESVIRQYELQNKKNLKKLTKKEEKELFELNQLLDEIGFNQRSIDPLYDKFIDELLKLKEFKYKPQTSEEEKKQDELVMKVLKKISK